MEAPESDNGADLIQVLKDSEAGSYSDDDSDLVLSSGQGGIYFMTRFWIAVIKKRRSLWIF